MDLARGFFRVMGRVRMTLLLGLTVAAYNLDRVRSFRAKHAADGETPKPRARRRRGTWADVVDTGGESAARSGAPPG